MCFVCDSLCDVVCGVRLCVFVMLRGHLFKVFARCCIIGVCFCCVFEFDCVCLVMCIVRC